MYVHIKNTDKCIQGETLLKRTLPSWKIPKFVGINFTNTSKVIKAPNEAKVTKVLYKQACNQEFFQAGEVSWNRDSLIKVSCYDRKAA